MKHLTSENKQTKWRKWKWANEETRKMEMHSFCSVAMTNVHSDVTSSYLSKAFLAHLFNSSLTVYFKSSSEKEWKIRISFIRPKNSSLRTSQQRYTAINKTESKREKKLSFEPGLQVYWLEQKSYRRNHIYPLLSLWMSRVLFQVTLPSEGSF